MVIPITTLWLPILVASVLVFLASFILNAVLKYHRSDYRPVANEDAAMATLRGLDLAPGDYMIPAGDPERARTEEFRRKLEQGPVVMMTVLPRHMIESMGSQLVQWFAFSVLVSILAAYLAGRLLAPGADYLDVFRVTGTLAFASYAMALMELSIWYGRSWSTTLKAMFDGLVYALLTAGVFGWLWPA